jgi:UDP-glucose 4-epimerase
MKLLVTGGAGYIGSHVVKSLGQAGHEIIVYDNLSTGHEWAILYGKLVLGDLADVELLYETLRDFKPDAIIHFAASIQVEESVQKPLLYYRNNVLNSINLLDAMQQVGVRYLIYSSTAAVYGNPRKMPVDENVPVNPINPYGASKVMMERILADTAKTSDLRYIALRYFNVAGADADGQLGQTYTDATHLITRALKTALGLKKELAIYGTDYPTPDGTCIRDYIHVNDLANAHVVALNHLIETNESKVMNCGYGHGFSVKEVVSMARKVTGIDFPVVEMGRRAGDAPAIIADGTKLRNDTGWRPQHDDMEFIIRTAWEWEKNLKTIGAYKKSEYAAATPGRLDQTNEKRLIMSGRIQS